MPTFRVEQRGNHIEIHGAGKPVVYDVTGTELPELTDHSFAVWHLLPGAMKTGGPIHIDGPVDPVVMANAEKFSRVWELWEPANFREVKVTASEEAPPTTAAGGRRERLVCFSGGVDSTHMLLQSGVQEEAGTALTIHGMEIDWPNQSQFAELIRWTDPLLGRLNYDRITVRTNVTDIGGGYHSWALTLAGCSFLFRHAFERGVFASDFMPAEHFIVFPYGCNPVTNPLLAGSDYRLESLFEDTSRVAKVGCIASHDAVGSLSFCKRKELRPKNCGECNKCIRTKIMMAASSGTVPDVFLEPALTRKFVNSLDLSIPIERTFFITSYQAARANGTLSAIPGMEERFESLRNPLAVRIRRLFRGR